MPSSIDWGAIIIALITSGAITSLILLPQRKKSAKIDNAQKLCDEYAELLGQYKERDAQQEQRINALTDKVGELEVRYETRLKELRERHRQEVADIKATYEERIEALQKTIAEMQDEINTLKRTKANVSSTKASSAKKTAK